MRQWWAANGGWLALVIFGLFLTGLKTAYGWVIVGFGALWPAGRALLRRLPSEIRRKNERAPAPSGTEAIEAPAMRLHLPEKPCERFNHVAGGECIFCHAAVTAVSDQFLRNCHTRLTRVRRATPSGWEQDDRFAAPIRLKWAHAGRDHPEVEYRDLQPGETALLDVVYTLERSPGRAYIETLDALPIGMPRDLTPSVYLVTVRALADGRDPVDATFMLGVQEGWQGVFLSAMLDTDP